MTDRSRKRFLIEEVEKVVEGEEEQEGLAHDDLRVMRQARDPGKETILEKAREIEELNEMEPHH